MVPAMRVAVVGAGIMGCATALSLSRRAGVDVVVLERAIPGAEASSAAAGILGAQIEGHEPGAHFEMLRRAREAYPAFAAELREETGIDVGYKRCGVLKVALDEAARADLDKLVGWQKAAGLAAELVDGARARTIEPALGERIVAAAHFPDDAQVDPPSLLRALVAAIARRGVEVRSGVTVRGLRVENERCVGVALDTGDLRADAIVLAAGSWSSLVAGLPASLPDVKPVRGQLVQLDERPPRARTIVFGAGGYVVPRGDGRVICGSTMEQVGYRREVTAAGVHGILKTALTLVPSLADAQLGPAWSNFRPFAETPLIGASSLPGLFLATGHHRNGILLAPETGSRVAALVLGESK